MPYRDFTDRVENYDLAVIPDVVKTKFENRKTKMVQLQQRGQATLTDMEKKVRDILDENGIFGVFRVPYLNLARALFRAKGHQSGLALQKTANAWKQKAVAEGLDPDIVDKIVEVVIGAAAYA
ncbi:MAG: hypothetical protein J7J77_00945 [Candidatus Cloacimonetes bacterium]|nr:hypothetical protein [Candidatus Cloacimonadota bacterium]